MKVKNLLAVVLCFAGQALAQDSSNVRTVGYYDTPGTACGVTVSGNYAYVADGYSGLRILDISNPANPNEIGFYDTPDCACYVTVSGNYAYVADSDSGLRIIDISDPASPTEAGYKVFDNGGFAQSVAVSGCYAYVADGSEGLRIIDISNPESPTEAGYYYQAYGYSVVVSGNYAFVADGSKNLWSIDISDPTNPNELGRYWSSCGRILGVAVSGIFAFVVDLYDDYSSWQTTYICRLRVMNISNPASPVEIGHYDIGHYDIMSWDYSVVLSGRYAYVTDGSLHIIDISDPYHPSQGGHYTTSSGAKGVTVTGDYVYVANGEYGLGIYQGYGSADLEAKKIKLVVIGNRIEYLLQRSAHTYIKIYNLLGQKVGNITDEYQGAGFHQVTWNGKNQSGRRVSSGVYLVRLESNGQAATGKMLIVR